MGITLSHDSALHAARQLRAEGVDLRNEVDFTKVATPSPWCGSRWTPQEFADERWCWQIPTNDEPVHILISSVSQRARSNLLMNHLCTIDLPSTSILWLNEVASTVCPELLFVQMAISLPLPSLVLLGHELCGGFSCSPQWPNDDTVTEKIPPATSVEEIREFLQVAKGMRGARRAREALTYVSDGAVSFPESVLATMYSLPSEECGYGMGPVTLNKKLNVPSASDPSQQHNRYPDLLFSFAPIGINYDGEAHLDLSGLIGTAMRYAISESDDRPGALQKLKQKQESVRGKYVDDMRRNREFLARGAMVLPMTKEDLYGRGNLDKFTELLLACARNFFGADTKKYEEMLEDAGLARDRYTLLSTFLPRGTH